MPESNNPNYDTLIDTVNKQNAHISELEKKLDEVVSFNKSLLSSEKKPEQVDKEDDAKKLLNDYLEGK